MAQNKLPYGNSTFVNHQINFLTYLFYKALKLFVLNSKEIKSNQAPVLITGMFRSGTTITARLVKLMGYSAGQEKHLLQGKGVRKSLNPNGFLENYFFMDLSMFVFYKSNSWGDNPPSKEVLKNLDLQKCENDEGARFSILKMHDDRISNWNKIKTLIHADFRHPTTYLNRFYSNKSFIKNPHFSALLPFFLPFFPNSKIIFVFKHPASAIKSAKKVSENIDFTLYVKYYEEAVNHHKSGNANFVFYSYEHLISNPENSINQLALFLEVKSFNKNELINEIVKTDSPIEITNVPTEVIHLYKYMYSHAININ